MPAISIIIPTYNSASVITETLDSVREQTFKDYEVYIIDDCSTDNTKNILKSYIEKHQLKNFFSLSTTQNTGGPATPRNIGIQHASSELIAFLDSDDLWHPQKIEIQIALLNKLNSQILSSRKSCFKSQADIPALKKYACNFTPEFKVYHHKDLLKKNHINLSATLVKKQLLLSNPFNESQEISAVEDYDLWLRLTLQNYKAHVINEKLVLYRVSNTSISGNKLKQALKTYSRIRLYSTTFKSYYYFSRYCINTIIYKILKI